LSSDRVQADQRGWHDRRVSGTPRVDADPLELTMVAAAAARLGRSGAWDALVTGASPTDPLDRADADLLVACGILESTGDGYRLLLDDPWWRDGRRLANGATAHLRRALQHAQGEGGGWSGTDLDLVLDQGRSSAVIAGLLGERLFPTMDGAAAPFEAGRGRFLDVGVGVAAISVALCRRFPGTTCVGLDVLEPVLELARSEVAAAGLEDRIELRLQSVADLEDMDGFDIVWLPQPFIPRAAYDAGLARALRALRPGGWLVTPVMSVPTDTQPLDAALMAHAGHVLGGGPVVVADLARLLVTLGYEDVASHDMSGQMVLVARRPQRAG
jgi:SAM-dependent methyltransferase